MGIRSQRAQILLVFEEEQTEGALEEFGNQENNVNRIIKPEDSLAKREVKA